MNKSNTGKKGQKMTNSEKLKRKLRAEGVPQWRLAEAVGVHEQTLYRQLRHEITEERFKELSEVIDDIAKGENDE